MGFLPVPDPVAFSVFGIEIRWYAICVTATIIIAVGVAYYRCPKKGLDPDVLLDMFLWGVPAGIIGARAYYVIFEWDYYKANPSQILNFRAGGLAIHGGLILAFTAIYLVCRVRKQDFITWCDHLAPCWPLGQAIGRWGNYFNSEAHGGPTTLPWAIYADGELVHPTFLYESIWCFLLFIFLTWLYDKGKNRFKGQLISLYLMLYSVERFFVEALRTDSLYIGPLKQAQVISIVMFAGGAALYAYFRKKNIKPLN